MKASQLINLLSTLSYKQLGEFEVKILDSVVVVAIDRTEIDKELKTFYIVAQ